jgi:hypothetical protein
VFNAQVLSKQAYFVMPLNDLENENIVQAYNAPQNLNSLTFWLWQESGNGFGDGNVYGDQKGTGYGDWSDGVGAYFNSYYTPEGNGGFHGRLFTECGRNQNQGPLNYR